jgi:hypothetical protein
VEAERELMNGDSCLEANKYESKDREVYGSDGVYSSIYDGVGEGRVSNGG